MSKVYEESMKEIINKLTDIMKGSADISVQINNFIHMGQSIFNTDEIDSKELINIAYTKMDDPYIGKIAVQYIESFEELLKTESLSIQEVIAIKTAIDLLSNPNRIEVNDREKYEEPVVTIEPTETKEEVSNLSEGGEPVSTGSFPEEKKLFDIPKQYKLLDSKEFGLQGKYGIHMRSLFNCQTGKPIYAHKNVDGEFVIDIEDKTFKFVELSTWLFQHNHPTTNEQHTDSTDSKMVETVKQSIDIEAFDKEIPAEFGLKNTYVYRYTGYNTAEAYCIETGKLYQSEINTGHPNPHFVLEGRVFDLNSIDIRLDGTYDPSKYETKVEILKDEFTREFVWISWIPGIPANKYKLYRTGIIVNSVTDRQLCPNKNVFRFTATMCRCGERNSAIQHPIYIKRKKIEETITEMIPDFYYKKEEE